MIEPIVSFCFLSVFSAIIYGYPIQKCLSGTSGQAQELTAESNNKNSLSFVQLIKLNGESSQYDIWNYFVTGQLQWFPEFHSFGTCMSKARSKKESSSSSGSASSANHPANSITSHTINVGAGDDPPEDDKPVSYDKPPGAHYIDYEEGEYNSPPCMQVTGIDAVRQCLVFEGALQVVITPQDTISTEEATVIQRAGEQGVRIIHVSDGSLRRFDASNQGARILGFFGRPPSDSLENLFSCVSQARMPVIWMLAGVEYSGNIGAIIRTAEASGSAGVIICNSLSQTQRKNICHSSLGTHHFIPIFYEPCSPSSIISLASEAGLNVVALETTGAVYPWSVSWVIPTLIIVGGESEGVPESIINQCNTIVVIPTLGFMPSYNVHAAMAIILGEILRQNLRK